MNTFDKFLAPNMLSLNDIYAVKILICYFLKQIERPVTPIQLTEICTADGVINYFFFTEAINSMIESGTITVESKDGEEFYALSEIGYKGADAFKSFVPKSFRDRVLSAGLKFFARLKIDQEVTCDIIQNERGYTISCVCVDNDITLMDMKFFAPDINQAELIREKILINPSEFYSKVLDFCLDNPEFIPEID